MADSKISNLPPAGSLTGAELVPVVQSATTVQTTLTAITSWFSSLVATLTNKRVTLRVLPLSSNLSTYTINTDLYDVVEITGQTAAITSLTLTGTPQPDDPLIINITGTASVAVNLGASFVAGNSALPTTTLGTTRLSVGTLYNSALSLWQVQSGGGIQNTTISNTRTTLRIQPFSANATTYSLNTDNYDGASITGQTATVTSIATTGTPNLVDRYTIDITGSTTSFTLSTSSFEPSGILSLPTATSSTQMLSMVFRWNPATSKWRLAGIA